MVIKKYPILATILGLILASSISAKSGQPVESQPPVALQPSDIRVAQAEQLHTLWLEAVLDGNESEAARLEKDLVGLISHDILMVQEEVRQMAKDIALAPGVAADQDDNHAIVSLVSDRDIEFEQAIGFLNIKESLYRSVSKSESFSNKYRLLGDYINLLRRELKMPRLKLAQAKKGMSNNQTGQHPSAPANR